MTTSVEPEFCPEPCESPTRSRNTTFATTADKTGMPEPLDSAKKHLVLFVDDESEILASVRRLLVQEPYELLTTERPHQALQWVQEKDVSLIISDQVMPEMLGTDLLKQVRTCSPKTLCAILTGYPEGGKLLLGLNQGNFSIIAKPWDLEDLKGTIRTLLSRSRESARRE
jgi:DNA-binding NtrC family response regulator